MPVTTHSDALEQLTAADPVLGRLVARHGPPPPRRRVPAGRRFGDLARTIVYQQLAGRAAASIHGRFVEALEGDVSAERVLGTPEAVLRSCGLSGSKAASIRDLAEKVAAGALSLDRIGRLSNDEVVARLSVVRGVGPWTAQMFLMSTLGRPDVWPLGDYGVRVGFASAWELDAVPTPRQLDELGEPFRPHRSLVAWYCWRAVDER